MARRPEGRPHDAVERIKCRTFDNWSADALAEVIAEMEVSDGT